MKNIIHKNIGLKLTAVFLSIILWLFVTSRGQSEISLDVPVEFKEIPPGLEIVSQSARVVSLNMRGQEQVLKNVRLTDVRVSVDLSNARTGEITYSINRDNIQLPRAITVTNINPSSIKIHTEETARKTVKIIPIVTGEPEDGYAVKSVSVTPQRIEIEGSKREIRRVSTVKTDAIDVTGVSETFTQESKLDMTGHNVRAKNPTVMVHVEIGTEDRKK